MTAQMNTQSDIHSMTGYARAAGRVLEAGLETATWTLTIKSVNHRFLDLHLRLPGGTDALEMELRKRLKERVRRGHLEVTLTYDRDPANKSDSVFYNREIVAQYVAAFRAAEKEHNLSQQPDLNVALRLPGALGSSSSHTSSPELREQREAGVEALQRAVVPALDNLISQLNSMRCAEGRALAAVLGQHLLQIEQDLVSATTLRASVQTACLARLQDRMTQLVSTITDDNRLLQEAALLADRSDVEEELARLKVHLEHFRALLAAGGEVGKKLDFLLQEMNREANTLLAKSAGIPEQGARITEVGLNMKAVIEKIREQVQNIE